ncbi:response regulator transcription factor [Caldalkalibacillus mannanilyticus]|uniref:response regulator transcription factor n=1 Tax=Caldalkalibacillus mannanilyticus TaxID=1418 RepID=UPI000469322E|nr:response regulator transcription factor [Caldalkalibacillus mannanilyticus]
MIRVLIVDDDLFIRESLKLIIQQAVDMEVVGTCQQGEEAYQFCFENSTEVDVILMDIRMPVCDGVEATKRMKQMNPELVILILTTFDDDEYILEALKHGIHGYMLKNVPPDQILEGIRMVAQGHMLVHPHVARKLPSFLHAKPQSSVDLQTYGLTPTEQKILEHIAEGLSNKEISQALFLSEGTVKNYITQMLGKLQLRDRTQMAIFYLKNTSGA